MVSGIWRLGLELRSHFQPFLLRFLGAFCLSMSRASPSLSCSGDGGGDWPMRFPFILFSGWLAVLCLVTASCEHNLWGSVAAVAAWAGELGQRRWWAQQAGRPSPLVVDLPLVWVTMASEF
ncbi:hypothetical protein Dimus_019772 [Dionaea muscipula]